MNPPAADNVLPVFDAHLHIIDDRFPLVPNQGYLPAPFSADDYLQRMRGYRLAGGAVVSGSFQAFDQAYLLAALGTLGPTFVGVTQIPATVADEELVKLDAAGVRAVRFNLKRGGSEAVGQLERMALRVHERVGWHVELYVDAKALPELKQTLLALPAVCIDHLGLSQAGFADLLELVAHGVHVKATGFGRIDFDARTALREIVAVNPDALLFGTDLPSTRAPRPYRDDDFTLLRDTLGDELARKVLCDNAVAFYRPGRSATDRAPITSN